ncbi:hypothetical protein BJY01DRAFT_250907 [Aspergillus pseudoustus]|uniref:DUF1772-domain-containing protein n=1 Tax=Aspergillus pseudoustus TaxID=1810923 RepID=A0ABR4JES2_9EURO
MSSLVTTANVPVEAAGLASAFFLSGALFSLSHITLPSLRSSPAPQYTKLFSPISSYGTRFVPFATLFSSLSLCYSAYRSGKSQLYHAGFLVFGIFPWSLLVMHPIQQALEAYGGYKDDAWRMNKDAVEEADTFSKSWMLGNYVRSGFPLLGGIWAIQSLLAGRGGL